MGLSGTSWDFVGTRTKALCHPASAERGVKCRRRQGRSNRAKISFLMTPIELDLANLCLRYEIFCISAISSYFLKIQLLRLF